MPSSSPFLRLPAELRNQIYQLALSTPEPLVLISKYDGLATLLLSDFDGVTREFNQLKYVNKQVFTETEHIELKYNDITVNRTKVEDDPPAAQFLNWVYAMMPPMHSWLDGATVVLSDESKSYELSSITHVSDSARTMSYLARFCNAHIEVSIHYHLPQLNFAINEGFEVEDHLEDLDANICESIHAACFFIPALTTADLTLGPTFDPLFDAWSVAEQADRAEYWREQNDEVYEAEELQAQNILYLPSKVADIELVRNRVEGWFGMGSDTAEAIMEWVEHGIKASSDIARSV
jgi:hypothetical protein